MPFDILAGDSGMRESLLAGESAEAMRARWEEGYGAWRELFNSVAHYQE